MSKHPICIIISCLAAVLTLSSQEYHFDFLSIEDGLSQSSVNAMVQDEKGFLWLGTQDGLNRYDGHQFKIYKRDPFDTTTLSNNHITALLIDDRQRLWVGTQNGLNLFDPHSETFQRFQFEENNINSLSDDNIVLIYQDLNQHIWVGTSNGFNLVRETSHTKKPTIYSFDRYHYKKDFNRNQPGKNYISSILQTKDQKIWIGTFSGLYEYVFDETSTCLVDHKQLDFQNTPNYTYSQNKITALQEDKYQQLWIGTADGLIIAQKTGKSDIHLFDRSYSNQVDNYVNFIYKTKNGHMFLGLGNRIQQLCYINCNYKNKFKPFTSSPHGTPTLKGKTFTCVLEDQTREDVYWIGTALSGFCKRNRLRRKFYSDHLQDIPGLAGNNSVFYLLSDTSDMLWLGVEGKLLRYNSKTKSYIVNTKIPSNKYSLNTDQIVDLYQDNEGKIWAGTFDGLYHITKHRNGLYAHSYQVDPECEDKCNLSFFETSDHIYTGTLTGINLFDKKQKELLNCPLVIDKKSSQLFNYRITSMLLDQSNNFWAGTTNGLILYRNIEGKLIHHNFDQSEIFTHNKHAPKGLVDNHIFHMAEDETGNVWLGTQNGLVKVTATLGNVYFETFREQEGLANNVVYSIQIDEASGYLWLSTNNGLSRFNSSNQEFENFHSQDGLQSNEFNAKAFAKSSDGTFFYGGINGITWFKPEEIKTDTIPPKVWVTELKLNEKNHINLLSLPANEVISLGSDQNSFSIYFTGIDYRHHNTITYYYDLEGSSHQNVYLGKSQQVNFTNLAPGAYTFKVRAYGKGFTKNINVDQLKFVIKAPFWQTNLFYVLVLLSGIFLIWGTYHLNYRMKMSKINEIEKVRRNAARDFHDELGSKLSIISMYSKLAKNQSNGVEVPNSEHLNKVISTSNSLYDSMRNLLWTLNPEADTIQDLLLQLTDFGEEIFAHSNITFQSKGFEPQINEVKLPMEYKRHLLLIFKEAMNNALKHSKGSLVTLDTFIENNALYIILKDNGKGIYKTKSNQGEGLRNMKNRANKIKSQLLIKNDKGTSIQLICPIPSTKKLKAIRRISSFFSF